MIDVARHLQSVGTVHRKGSNQKEKKMALEMKAVCEKCGRSLVARGEAYICSYECIFCPSCAEQMHVLCPNCGGELVRRPRREDQQ
jgi:hypothetical protein